MTQGGPEWSNHAMPVKDPNHVVRELCQSTKEPHHTQYCTLHSQYSLCPILPVCVQTWISTLRCTVPKVQGVLKYLECTVLTGFGQRSVQYWTVQPKPEHPQCTVLNSSDRAENFRRPVNIVEFSSGDPT